MALFNTEPFSVIGYVEYITKAGPKEQFLYMSKQLIQKETPYLMSIFRSPVPRDPLLLLIGNLGAEAGLHFRATQLQSHETCLPPGPSGANPHTCPKETLIAQMRHLPPGICNSFLYVFKCIFQLFFSFMRLTILLLLSCSLLSGILLRYPSLQLPVYA